MVIFVATFVFITGANDGGVLLAMGVRYGTRPVAWLLLILVCTLTFAPLVFGLAVAHTLAVGLVPGTGGSATLAFFVGTGSALAVVGRLSRSGYPTSLTLAIVGGVSGAVAGLGLSVAWGLLGWVMLVGAAAPVVGVLLGSTLGWGARFLPGSQRLSVILPRAHLVAFTAQCVAYALNDGQKMIAVAAVAGGAATEHLTLLSGGVSLELLLALAAIAVVFVLGMLTTVHEVAVRIGHDLVPTTPLDAVVAQFAAAGAVLGSSSVGAPVSMTQSVAAGLIGVSGHQGIRRVRWEAVTRIAAAWVITLPATALAAFCVGALIRVLR